MRASKWGERGIEKGDQNSFEGKWGGRRIEKGTQNSYEGE